MLDCTALSTPVDPGPVRYQLEGAPGADPGGAPLGASGRAGLAAFLGFVRRAGVARTLAERLRLPVQQRRSGFTVVQKSLALLAALAAGCRSARDGDFVLAGDPLAPGLLGLPRWPHSSQPTRHLRTFGAQHVAALRAAVEDLTASHSTARRRLARYEAVCALHAEGTSLRAIARRLELAPGTVHRYIRAGAFPEQQPRPRRRTLLTPFEAELRARWDAGCHNGAALWRELRARGFRGGKAIVRERLARWRATDGAAPAGPGPARPGSAAAVPLPTYSVRQVTWQLLRGPEDLDADEHSFLEALCAALP